jgi:membrane protein YdbS with pleckstrin-like domain
MHLSGFIRQKNYEHIIRTVRRSFITFIPTIVLTAILLAVPIILKVFLDTLFPDFLATTTLLPIFILFISLYYLSIGLFFYSSFVIFYLDMLVITNDRLLDIEQKNLFARTIAEADLYQIQDVSSEIIGFFPTLFNYGNLTIQTAGAVLKFEVSNVHGPDALRQEILELAEADRKFHAGDGTKL